MKPKIKQIIMHNNITNTYKNRFQFISKYFNHISMYFDRINVSYNRIAKIFLILLFFGSGNLSAQKYFVKNQYLINDFLLNPAFAGIKKRTDIMLLHRQQWVGIEDSPNTTTLSANGYIGDNAGIGGIFHYDENGYNYNYGASAAYAYHLRFNRDYYNWLSFGLASNVNYSGIDLKDIKQDVFDHVLNNTDGYWEWNFTFGFFYQLKDFRTSLSINNFLTTKPSTLDQHYEPHRKGNASILCRYKLGNEINIFIPGVMYRASFDMFEQEYNINLKYIHHTQSTTLKTYAMGVSYQDYTSKGWRQDRSVHLFVEFKFPKFALTYANNIEFNTFQTFNSGSHTIGISYYFPDITKTCFCFE